MYTGAHHTTLNTYQSKVKTHVKHAHKYAKVII